MNDFLENEIKDNNHNNDSFEVKGKIGKKKKGGFFKFLVMLLLILIAVLVAFSFWYKNGIKPKKNENKKEVIFTVDDKTTVRSLGKILKDADLIRDEKAYRIYIRLNKVNLINKGKYKADTDMTLKQILNMVEKGQIYTNNIDITFVEGSNIESIVKKVASSTKITEEEMYNALEDREYLKKLCNTYWFLKEEDIFKEGVKHPLEGYLFPDTYRFDKDEVKPDQIIEIMLRKMDEVLSANMKRVDEISFNVHEILTLASVIEKETSGTNDREIVAGLFINRLNRGMPLGSDPTTHYEVGTPLSEPLTQKQLDTEGKYNTRGPNMEGKLPIGPIASPSKSSIEAVLNYKNTDALFFVSDKNGKLYFTKNLKEHEKIINKLKSKDMWHTFD